MKIVWTSLLVAASLVLSLAGCSRSEARDTAPAVNTATETNKDDTGYIQCTDPRPEICYEIYAPVCASRDNGIRCITAPCPSVDKVTYSNDCTACSDPKVMGYTKGQCP